MIIIYHEVDRDGLGFCICMPWDEQVLIKTPVGHGQHSRLKNVVTSHGLSSVTGWVVKHAVNYAIRTSDLDGYSFLRTRVTGEDLRTGSDAQDGRLVVHGRKGSTDGPVGVQLKTTVHEHVFVQVIQQ